MVAQQRGQARPTGESMAEADVRPPTRPGREPVAPRRRRAARLAGVLLDVDGTLVDSNDAHARAWVETLAEYGYQVRFTRIRPLIGMGGDKLLCKVAGVDVDSAEGRSIERRRQEIFAERELPHLQPCRGARALVQHIRDEGLTIVVASSAKADELRPLLERAQVADLIAVATSSDDAERSKPDPDIVRAALQRGGFSADRTVMIGDTPYDLEAAARSHVPLIALRRGGWDDDALRGAVAIYDDPLDLLAHF